jgi:hypothetical protein
LKVSQEKGTGHLTGDSHSRWYIERGHVKMKNQSKMSEINKSFAERTWDPDNHQSAKVMRHSVD